MRHVADAVRAAAVRTMARRAIMTRADAYRVMDLQPEASRKDAHERYRELAKTYHPDADHGGDETRMKRLN
eukprot:gene26533-54055_t